MIDIKKFETNIFKLFFHVVKFQKKSVVAVNWIRGRQCQDSNFFSVNNLTRLVVKCNRVEDDES